MGIKSNLDHLTSWTYALQQQSNTGAILILPRCGVWTLADRNLKTNTPNADDVEGGNESKNSEVEEAKFLRIIEKGDEDFHVVGGVFNLHETASQGHFHPPYALMPNGTLPSICKLRFAVGRSAANR